MQKKVAGGIIGLFLGALAGFFLGLGGGVLFVGEIQWGGWLFWPSGRRLESSEVWPVVSWDSSLSLLSIGTTSDGTRKNYRTRYGHLYSSRFLFGSRLFCSPVSGSSVKPE